MDDLLVGVPHDELLVALDDLLADALIRPVLYMLCVAHAYCVLSHVIASC